MTIPFWQYALSMGGYFGFLVALIAFMRRNYKVAHVFWILSLFTFPIWLAGGVTGWFRWMKILSVLLPTIVVGFARIANYENRTSSFWSFFKRPWAMWFFYVILFLNILEATIKDFTTGHIFNALCGFLLCVTIPFPSKFWEISKKKYGDLVSYTTVAWNFLYTTWNACFVYGESPVYFASSLCILLAAEIYPIIVKRPELYIMSRVYTLAAHLLIRACLPGVFPVLMDASSWHNPKVLAVWGMINCALLVPYVFWHMWQLHTGRADQSFRRVAHA